jgi:3-dehydroquinate synthase
MQATPAAVRELTVELGPRSYPILIGPDVLLRPELVCARLPGPQVLVVTNATVAPLYLERVQAALVDRDARALVLPDGEQHKTLAQMERIVTELLTLRFGRDACIIALGGGVVGDLAGFAAACYQRGIAYIQAPTTLLAQVDSAVGGKTAVNHPLGKNMIGAFHQPRAVIADTSVLRTLPQRELRAGLAEVIKYGLIRDAAFFAWLEQSLEALLALDPEALQYAIERSCRTKADIVAADETEGGDRALLNLGHTFGHAIETALDYRGWLHGEAVAAGMVIAADLSARLGRVDQDTVMRVRRLLERAGLPVRLAPGLVPRRIRELMGVDKKSRSGRLRLVLLESLGNAVLVPDVDETALMETLEAHAAPPR